MGGRQPLSARPPDGRPWPAAVDQTRAELDAYLATASRPDLWDLPTRCPPWTVRDVTRHLAATFQRFADMLEQSRAGDLSPPFARTELDAENLRAVEDFTGVPEERLAAEARRFLDHVGDGDELMAHQRGSIPVALQVLFGLHDVVLHHDDVAVASGTSYRPPEGVVALLVPVWELLGLVGVGDDPWPTVTRRGRDRPGP